MLFDIALGPGYLSTERTFQYDDGMLLDMVLEQSLEVGRACRQHQLVSLQTLTLA